jgi:hypothetical protein
MGTEIDSVRMNARTTARRRDSDPAPGRIRGEVRQRELDDVAQRLEGRSRVVPKKRKPAESPVRRRPFERTQHLNGNRHDGHRDHNPCHSRGQIMRFESAHRPVPMQIPT